MSLINCASVVLSSKMARRREAVLCPMIKSTRRTVNKSPGSCPSGIDLGRPTLRGTRKCPQCSTVNGTRSPNCKNKNCKAPFNRTSQICSSSRRINNERASPEAVKLVTGSTERVYSVRVRDRRSDYRGFVHMSSPRSVNELNETNKLIETTKTMITVETSIARCFIDTCFRFTSETDEIQTDNCQHVRATICCNSVAVPLGLNKTVLNGLRVTSEIKQAIWLLATWSPGPLVQRISKNVMVVKCKVDQEHPLGFLHVSFYENITRNRKEYKFICTCSDFRHSVKSPTEENCRRCVHLYACVCAFSSNDQLSKEFSHYLKMVNNSTPIEVSEFQLNNVLENGIQQLVSQRESDGKSCVVVVSAKVDDSIAKTVVQKQKGTSGESEDINTSNLKLVALKKKPRCKSVMLALASSGKPQTDANEESRLTLTFIDWLESVTERINQTMHYGSSGRPDPLVFLVPQHFFDCLQQRLASQCRHEKSNRKRRLPNVTTFVRSDSPPIGIFSKYSWHINDMTQIIQLFDTPKIPLEIIRNFTENRDGTYDVFVPKQPSSGHNLPKSGKELAIKPFELKTFLKVGFTNPEDKQSTSFVIEWIPDVQPKSRIGELSLSFQYGHQRNGQIEQRS